MRIVCPSCSAAYDVPEALLAGREAVRCARCAQEWQPDLPEPPPSPVMIDAAATARRSMAGGDWAIDRLMSAPQPPSRGRLALVTGWVASVVVLLALLVSAYVWRSAVMDAWPPSVRLYSALGLADGTP